MEGTPFFLARKRWCLEPYLGQPVHNSGGYGEPERLSFSYVRCWVRETPWWRSPAYALGVFRASAGMRTSRIYLDWQVAPVWFLGAPVQNGDCAKESAKSISYPCTQPSRMDSLSSNALATCFCKKAQMLNPQHLLYTISPWKPQRRPRSRTTHPPYFSNMLLEHGVTIGVELGKVVVSAFLL